MRKTLVALAGVSILALSFASAAQAAPAKITRDFGCNLFNGNGSLVTVRDATLSVVTSSGNANLTCRATGLTPPPDGKAAVQRGFGCNTFLGFTTKSHSTVSPSGNSKLVCQVKH